MSLSKEFDLFMKKTDQLYNGRENYRVQQEYIRMLHTEPRVLFPIIIRSSKPDDDTMDI